MYNNKMFIFLIMPVKQKKYNETPKNISIKCLGQMEVSKEHTHKALRIQVTMIDAFKKKGSREYNCKVLKSQQLQ